MQTLFYEEIGKLMNPHSHESRTVANMLEIKQADVPIIIRDRMDPRRSSFHNIITIFADYGPEKTFAESIGVNAEKWLLFVQWIKTRVEDLYAKQQYAQQQQQLQLQQQQLQQQQQKKKMELTPEQHAQLQQQIRLMLDNWERIRQNLSNCEDDDTNRWSQNLGVDCDSFVRMLTTLGQDFTNSLFEETLNVEQQRQVATQLKVEPDKWIEFITELHQMLRTPFIQSVASHKNQIASRALEDSQSQHTYKPMPDTGVGSEGQDIDESHNSDFAPIKAHIHAIISDRTIYAPYIEMIYEVLGKEYQPITSYEYKVLFGGPSSTEPLIPAEIILLDSFKSRFDPSVNVEEAYQFACRAYLDANPNIISQLESYEPDPKRLYVIARLMRHFITIKFDRNQGRHLGGKKSRSKKRGVHRRKSIHRRKKSSHKKRK